MEVAEKITALPRLVLFAVLWLSVPCALATALPQRSVPLNPAQAPSTSSKQSGSVDIDPDDELRQGTALTRKGLFREAIPHLLAAHGHVTNEYAANFNLAICYRPHRGAVTSDQIYPGMLAVFVQYRMISIEAKAGGNIFKVQRKPQRFCTERVAASIVETRTAVIVAESDCG